MEPPVLLFLGLTLILITFSKGIPQNEDNSVEDAEEDRRSLTSAHATAAAGISQNKPPGTSECFACTDCPNVLLNSTVRQCGYSPSRCVVYSEKYNYISRPIYVRGCVSERGSCDDIRRSHEGHQNVVKMLSCQECLGDKCNANGVSRSLPDLTTALFFMTVTPVVTKYALS